MTKINAWASILAAGATVGLVAYVVTRRAGQHRPLSESSASERRVVANLAAAPVAERKVASVVPNHDEAPTVQFLMKAPTLVGSDDGDALDPDDLGADWLARAAQSERSLGESDLDVALDDIPDPSPLADAGEDPETPDV